MAGYVPYYGPPGSGTGWEDGVNGHTPTTGAALDNMESGIVAALRAPVTVADGQLAAWNVSTGLWVAVNPTGASELASAVNTTGTATTASAAAGLGTAVAVTGVSISVAASNGRPVTLHYGGTLIQTVAGQGNAYLELQEGATGIQSAVVLLPNSIAAQTSVLTMVNQFPLGVVASTRTFFLQFQLYSPAANNPTATMVNNPSNPTFLRAVAG